MSYHEPELDLRSKPRFFYGYNIVAYCYVTTIIVWGVYNSFGVFFDSLLAEFHWSRAVTSGAFSLCTIFSGLAAIPFGRITDKFGPRLVMTACSLLLGAGYILMSLINNVWQFYIVYGVMIGIGTSGFWVPVLSTVSRWFSRKRGLMVGLVLTGSGVGTIIFPPLANWLISLYHWRTSIAILGLVTLIIGIILSQFIKRDPSSTGQQPDGEIGIVNINNSTLNKGYSLKEAIHTLQFWIAIIIFLCCGFFGCTVLVHIVPYAILYGISPTTAANMVAVIGGFSIIGGLCTGRMVDKIGIKKSLITFLSIATAALIWLIISKETWQIGLFAVIFGFAYGSVGVSETIISIWLFGLKSNALILALIDFGLTLGAAVGPVIAGYTFDITVSYRLAFVITALISVIGLLLSIFIKPPKARVQDDF